MKIYVGNLSSATTEQDLQGIFKPFGAVESITIITDRATGGPKGFGFVEMQNNEEAQQAINGLNNSECGGKVLKVNEAKPREAGGGKGAYRAR